MSSRATAEPCATTGSTHAPGQDPYLIRPARTPPAVTARPTSRVRSGPFRRVKLPSRRRRACSGGTRRTYVTDINTTLDQERGCVPGHREHFRDRHAHRGRRPRSPSARLRIGTPKSGWRTPARPPSRPRDSTAAWTSFDVPSDDPLPPDRRVPRRRCHNPPEQLNVGRPHRGVPRPCETPRSRQVRPRRQCHSAELLQPDAAWQTILP